MQRKAAAPGGQTKRPGLASRGIGLALGHISAIGGEKAS
jgi:hypothetical protein